MQNILQNRQNLYKIVSEFLIDCFINGTYKPGDRIIESKIANKLRISQGAVREAIRVLVEKGFLIYEPFKGARFKEYSFEDLEDCMRVRIELEEIAIKWAIEKHNWKKFDVTYLENLFKKMLSYVEKKEYLKRTKKDQEFHRHLVIASGSESLLNIWTKLSDYYWVYVWLFFDRFLDKSFLQEKSIRHQPIIEAIKCRDRKLLIKSLESHFINLRKFIKKNMKE